MKFFIRKTKTLEHLILGEHTFLLHSETPPHQIAASKETNRFVQLNKVLIPNSVYTR